MDRTDFGRIVAFTDGVMAVAITLLVLNIEVPQVQADDLGDALRELDGSLFSYVLSFALIGRFWVIHHNLFETLVRFDGRLMALNLVFLMLVALLPFATDLADQYEREPIAVATLGATLALVAFVHWCMTAYALRRGFVHDERVHDTTPFGGVLALGFTLIFAISVPVAFLSPLAAKLIWISTILLRFPLRTVTERLAGESG